MHLGRGTAAGMATTLPQAGRSSLQTLHLRIPSLPTHAPGNQHGGRAEAERRQHLPAGGALQAPRRNQLGLQQAVQALGTRLRRGMVHGQAPAFAHAAGGHAGAQAVEGQGWRERGRGARGAGRCWGLGSWGDCKLAVPGREDVMHVRHGCTTSYACMSTCITQARSRHIRKVVVEETYTPQNHT